MDIQRIQLELFGARQAFPWVELQPTSDGQVYVKAVLQTSAACQYVIAIYFPNYPFALPQVHVTAPNLLAAVPHRYQGGSLCYLHPSMWNPGLHNLAFVLMRTAKWLNKYEVWRETGRWPGAQLAH